jgi:hypothetical protein
LDESLWFLPEKDREQSTQVEEILSDTKD